MCLYIVNMFLLYLVACTVQYTCKWVCTCIYERMNAHKFIFLGIYIRFIDLRCGRLLDYVCTYVQYVLLLSLTDPDVCSPPPPTHTHNSTQERNKTKKCSVWGCFSGVHTYTHRRTHTYPHKHTATRTC